jgi:hypothetical protein
MSGTLAPPPSQDSIIELDGSVGRKQPFYVAKPWMVWFQDALGAGVQASISRVQTVSVPNTTDAGTGDIPTRTLYTVPFAGLYRLSCLLRISQAATVSSDVQVTFSWVRAGVTIIETLPIVTGNTTATVQGETGLAHADALTDLTYAVATHSSGVTPMTFELDLFVEHLS